MPIVSKAASKRRTKKTQAIESRLREAGYPQSEAYELPRLSSIRLRVIDERFHGKNRVQREEMILPIVRQLPEEILMDLTVLLLITPDEVESSFMNLEFERPLAVKL